jgi:methyl-accepting chemotaxis protein
MLGNLRIGLRLTLGFGTVLLLALVAIAVGWIEVQSVAQRSDTLLHQPLTKERITSDWYRVIDSGSKRTLAMVVSGDPVLEETFRDDMKASSAKSTQYQNQLKEMATSPEEVKLLEAVGKARTPYVKLRDEVAALRRAGRDVETSGLVQQMKSATAAYLSALQGMLDYERAAIDKQAAETKAEAARTLWVLGVLGALVLAMGSAFAYAITQGITRPLKAATEVAHRIAAGDVNTPVQVDRKDELGQLQQAMAEMAGQLRGMITAVRDSASVIAGASQEIAGGNSALSQRTEDQAASLQRTASSIEQLSAAVRSNADSSTQAQSLVESAANCARSGDEVVKRVIVTMKTITASSKRISDIIGVIDGIAFQTNILALNAAVEAARAGEQGRGFAVVAAEVRTLAQRSATAAKEIRSLILKSVDDIDSGAQQVEQAGGWMQSIRESVERVNQIIDEITLASQQQATGIQGVNRDVSDLESTTQQNSALVEESAAAAMSLQEQSRRLVDSIDAFGNAH